MTVVTLGSGYEETLPVWHIAPDPVRMLGSRDGPQPYLFDGIVDATLFADGGLAVLDGSSQELRFFDANGQFVSRTEGEGSGPGEFLSARWMLRVPGDSLIVWDPRVGRITWMDREGSLLETRPVGGPAVYHYEGALLPDGSRVAADFFNPRPPTGAETWRPNGVLVRVRLGSTSRDTLGPFRNAEQGITVTLVVPHRTYLAADGLSDLWALGDSEHDVRLFTVAGSLQVIVRWGMEPATTTDEAVAIWRAEIEERLQTLAAAGGVSRRLVDEELRRVAGVTPGQRIPRFGGIVMDSGGHTWVESARVTAEEPRVVTVFARGGTPLARVTYPPELRVLEIGSEYVLGVARDPLGVESLRLHRLTR